MDETLFVNAATLRIPNLYIVHQFHGIPLMVFPYIGALKSWLYAPVFGVFGTSPTTIRLPAVLIASVGLLLLYFAVRDLVNRPVAILAFVVLCFDNSVFWLTRDDVGPSAIEFFLKCAALLCAARIARTRSLRWTVLLLVVLGLGVFNKLNFIWTVNAVSAVSVLVLVHYRASLRAHSRLVAMWLIGLGVIYACFALYYFADHIGSLVAAGAHSSLAARWPQFDRGTRAILSGTWFYDYALRPLDPRETVVWIVVALFAVGALASTLVPRMRNLAVAGSALATVLIAIQNLLTVQATAGWHYISIYPFVTVVASYGAYALARTLLRRDTGAWIVLACIGISAVVYSGALLAKYFRTLADEPRFSAWSPEIYDLSRYLGRRNGTIFTADWGIFNPLFALKQERRYRELGYGLANPTRADLKAIGSMLATTPGPKLVVTHGDDKLVFPESNANLFRAAAGHLRIARKFLGPDGSLVYEVFAYR